MLILELCVLRRPEAVAGAYPVCRGCLQLSKIREGQHTEPVIVDFMKNSRRYAMYPNGDVFLFRDRAGLSTPQNLDRISVIQFFDPGESNKANPQRKQAHRVHIALFGKL